MSTEAVCTECGFRVPWDCVGAAMMASHLKEHDRPLAVSWREALREAE